MTTLPDHRDGWTVDDLDDVPADGMRYGLLDGMLLVSPPAAFGHYSAAFELGVLLRAVLDDSWRIAAGPGVGMGPRNSASQTSSSPGERLVKPAQYARAGIAHDWRVEQVPGAAPLLLTHVLDGDVYRETGRFTDEVVIEEPVRLRFVLADLLD